MFADCLPDTWNVDPADVERKITERTKALLIVHLYGNPANVEALSKIAQRHNLKLIFDGAHAFGSKYRGRPIGQFGDAEVFSLSPDQTAGGRRRRTWSPPTTPPWRKPSAPCATMATPAPTTPSGWE